MLAEKLVTTVSCVIILLLGLTGCDLFDVASKKEDTQLQAKSACKEIKPSKPGKLRTIDDRLVGLAQQVDGFGGYDYDPRSNTLGIYLLNPENRTAAEEAQSTLASMFSNERLRQAELRVLEGQYDYKQLNRWMDLSTNILSLPNVVSQDLDESENRVVFGVSDESASACVLQNAESLGIPREAIRIIRKTHIRQT